MLVDEDQPVLGLGDDIGGGDLAAGDAEREAVGLGRRGLGRLGAGGGGESRRGDRARQPLPSAEGLGVGLVLSETRMP